MKIDHIHFFVEDAACQRDWFVQRLGWTWVKQVILPEQITEILRYRDTLFVLSSPRGPDSPIAEYLRAYAPGVVDVAVEVDCLTTVAAHPDISVNPLPNTGTLLDRLPELTDRKAPSAWLTVAGWGRLRHTLVERRSDNSLSKNISSSRSAGVDHIVLNVPAGELQPAVDFYQTLFKLQKQQSFKIQTEQSGLSSQVLHSPASQLYFNINEPASDNSQIQTFLETNRGAGIQHIALHSEPIVPTVAWLRQQKVPLLSVPLTYYHQLQRRLAAPIQPQEWQQIVEQQILVDWQPKQPESLLLQIFSRPIFPNNHFFFEFIERRRAVQGFGEGNFLALYRAIEEDMGGLACRYGLAAELQ